MLALFMNFRSNEILCFAGRFLTMDAFHRDILAANVSSDGRIVVRRNNPLIFICSPRKQARELQIRPAL